jgi:predicted esterase YcpF (UPF0227 family)
MRSSQGRAIRRVDTMILNIHGYKGSSENTMWQILRDLFPDEEIVSPQLDYDSSSPSEVRAFLDTLITADVELIVGTSLGGFFAVDLWARNETIPAILFNPALRPWEQLAKLESEGVPESFEAEYKSILEEARAKAARLDKDNLRFICGKNDDVVGITPLSLALGYKEFAQTGDAEIGGIEVGELWMTTNISGIDCGHSAYGDSKAIDEIKEIILTLHHNEYSNSLAHEDKRDYHKNEAVLAEETILHQMAEELGCDCFVFNVEETSGEVFEDEHGCPRFGILAFWGKKGFRRIDFLPDSDISTVPESIGSFPNLERLFIQSNPIEKLPETIGNLGKLEFLCLSYSGIEKLPDSIGSLKRLRRLNIRETGITELPASLTENPELEIIM